MSLSQFIPDSSDENILKTPLVKIRGKIMIFGNVVYQISNISSIGFVNLSTIKETPKFYWFLVGLGAIIFIGSLSSFEFIGILIGLIFVALGIYLIKQHNKNRVNERYGMTIYCNSGYKSILTSGSKEFVYKAILTLSNVMDRESDNAINMNFRDCEILSDKSVMVDKNNNSPIVTGVVEGDLVNSVQ